MEERLYWLGFSMFPGVGPKKFSLLLEKFGTAKAAWEADEESLRPIVGRTFIDAFINFRKNAVLEAYAEKLEKNNVSFLPWLDEEYPLLLKEIDNPPIVLYVKGNIAVISKEARLRDPLHESIDNGISHPLRGVRNDNESLHIVAIVGTRKITSYGREVTTRITEELVAAGFIIVSGLAFGVDAVAHTVTLHNAGTTIAVLGCGIDCPSPREHAGLYYNIIESGGAIVSEYPFDEPPHKGSFPSRNRIIAGLSQAVIVTEGAADSGALYTAEDAFRINRPVFAVPGLITSSLSKGPHALIAKGAHLITSGEDVLAFLGTKGQSNRVTKVIKGETEEEQRVIDLLQNERMHFDELVRRVNMDSAKVGALISIMEMKGMIESVENGLFRLVS